MSWFRSRSKNSPQNNAASSPPINNGRPPSFHAPSPINYGTYFPPPPASPYGGAAIAPQSSPSPSYLAPIVVGSPHEGYLSPQAVPDSRVLGLRGDTSVFRTPPPPTLPPRQAGSSPPSPYLSPQTPSQWNNSSIGRTPSPYQMPLTQSEVMKKEPPKMRKILSLGIHTSIHLKTVLPVLTCPCLDGGGVRGLSIIMILKSVMRNLNRKRKTNLEPWQEFDMIGGTSTGG